jgi:hypothetical protein
MLSHIPFLVFQIVIFHESLPTKILYISRASPILTMHLAHSSLQDFIIPTIQRDVGMELLYQNTKLTAWSNVILEKLTVTQLVKKFPAFYVTWMFITMFRRAHN